GCVFVVLAHSRWKVMPVLLQAGRAHQRHKESDASSNAARDKSTPRVMQSASRSLDASQCPERPREREPLLVFQRPEELLEERSLRVMPGLGKSSRWGFQHERLGCSQSMRWCIEVLGYSCCMGQADRGRQ